MNLFKYLNVCYQVTDLIFLRGILTLILLILDSLMYQVALCLRQNEAIFFFL